MLRRFFLLLVLGSFGCFLYGSWNIFIEREPNQCRMTYMFQTPQFSRVRVRENRNFPNYGLYYYNEGPFPSNVSNLQLNGAPVLFVPGNAGSYKQSRSLASVALRKGIHNEQRIHLDYFAIDYNEELSGLYGGYLFRQAAFLEHCIKAILKLYKNAHTTKRQIVLIGHSMGGKVVQSVLTLDHIAEVINSIIYISSPLDSPVVNFDHHLNAFYALTNRFLAENRRAFKPNASTNVCNGLGFTQAESRSTEESSTLMENVLLISIGGGNRDLLVRPALTNSIYSDIHAMTSAIPQVGVSCDHLSAVWCLQLMLVINRFLFSITVKDEQQFVYFKNDKDFRLQQAAHYFVKPRLRALSHEVDIAKRYGEGTNWQVDLRRVYVKSKAKGLRQNYVQLIPLNQYTTFRKLYIEVVNMNDEDSLYGCAAETNAAGKAYCEMGSLLNHHFQEVLSKDGTRSVAILDLHNIRNTYKQWTHLALAIHATNDPIKFMVDIHQPTERHLRFKAPRWFATNKKILVKETSLGAMYYKVMVEDLTESYQAVDLIIEPIACVGNSHLITTKICTPWAPGFQTYRVFAGHQKPANVYVNVPISTPAGYNSSKNPVVVELFLDPTCRFSISYKFSVADTMSRLVEQFYHWLPAHITAALFTVLKIQILQFYNQNDSRGLRPHHGFFQYTSLYIVTACRVVHKLLRPLKSFPSPEVTNYSIVVALIIQGTAIVASVIVCFALWALLAFYGNLLSKVLQRFVPMSFAAHSLMEKVITSLPISFGVLVVALAFRTCGGLALIVASIVYLVLLSNAYKDYLENWMWNLAMKMFRKLRSKNNRALTLPDSLRQNTTNELIQCDGMQNFSYHIALLSLLGMMTALNATATIAWVKNYRIDHPLPDASLVPAIIVLVALSFLWQLEAPKKSCIFTLGYRVVSIMLYICASICILYCQDAAYRLNYVIAFVFVLLLGMELLCWFFVKLATSAAARQ